MAEPATAEVVEPTLDYKLDKLFGTSEEQPQEGQTESVEAEAETPPTETGEESAPTETPTETEVESIEVEFNGQKYQVPPELKDVLMKSSDYTQKTQSLAQQRRDIELQAQQFAVAQQSQAFEQSISNELETLKMLEQYIPYMKQNTNWDGLTTYQFVRKQKEISDLADQHRALSAAISGKRQEFQTKLEGERQKLRKQTAEVLAKAIPGWNDKSQGEVEAYVKTLGYPEVAIPHMTSLDYQVAWKAAQYDKLKASTTNAVKKAAEAPVIKATSRKEAMPKQVRAKLDLKNAVRTGDQGKISSAVNNRLSQLFGD